MGGSGGWWRWCRWVGWDEQRIPHIPLIVLGHCVIGAATSASFFLAEKQSTTVSSGWSTKKQMKIGNIEGRTRAAPSIFFFFFFEGGESVSRPEAHFGVGAPM